MDGGGSFSFLMPNTLFIFFFFFRKIQKAQRISISVLAKQKRRLFFFFNKRRREKMRDFFDCDLFTRGEWSFVEGFGDLFLAVAYLVFLNGGKESCGFGFSRIEGWFSFWLAGVGDSVDLLIGIEVSLDVYWLIELVYESSWWGLSCLILPFASNNILCGKFLLTNSEKRNWVWLVQIQCC